MFAWHGTNQDFDVFECGMLGCNTDNAASRAGFFFTLDWDVAASYARQAERNLPVDLVEHDRRVDDLIEDMDRAMRAGDHDRYEALCVELDEFERTSFASEGTARVLLVDLDIRDPLYVDGHDPDVIRDLHRVIRCADQDGHDALVIENIADTPDGHTHPATHIVMFEPEFIMIDRTFFLQDFPAEPFTLDRMEHKFSLAM